MRKGAALLLHREARLVQGDTMFCLAELYARSVQEHVLTRRSVLGSATANHVPPLSPTPRAPGVPRALPANQRAAAAASPLGVANRVTLDILIGGSQKTD